MTRFDLTRRDLIQLGGYGLLASAGLSAQPAEANGPDGSAPLYLPTSSGGLSGARFARTPAWAREAPGLYVPNTLSAGYGLLNFPDMRMLPSQIHSFEELPKLVKQAQSVGTNIVYLVDWYEGGWANKGDYIPSEALGGAAKLTSGLAKAHAGGGKVILYVEGLIVVHASKVGADHGAEWTIIARDGNPLVRPYPGIWKMCPAAEGWAAYLEALAIRLASYGADGIYFDDWGDPEEFPCYSTTHGHAVGDKQAYTAGQINCAKRVRAALESGRPQGAIIVTEGPFRNGLFAYIDGSLEGELFSFVSHSEWDAQGQTDTYVPSMSIDNWHQTLALGAKLACPRQFLDAPPPPSAAGFLDNVLSKLNARNAVDSAKEAVWGVHRWRNAGVMLGLPMPNFGSLKAGSAPSGWPTTEEGARKMIANIQAPAVAIDTALMGKTLPSAPAYLKTLLNARRALAKVIDYGSSVTRVEAGSPNVVGWSFNGGAGTALTAVNVDDAPQSITFSGAAGAWQDQVTNERFFAKGATLTVPIPAHRVRLLLSLTGLPIPQPNPKNLPKF